MAPASPQYEKALLRGYVESCANLTWCTNPQGCDRILCRQGLGCGTTCSKCGWASCFSCSFPEVGAHPDSAPLPGSTPLPAPPPQAPYPVLPAPPVCNKDSAMPSLPPFPRHTTLPAVATCPSGWTMAATTTA